MAEIKIKGDISGSTTIKAPDSGSDEVIELSTVLDGKAPLDSPTFTGTPALPDGTTLAGAALTSGKILQIVRATDGTNRTTTSTSFVDVTGMSVTITPENATSAILLIATFQSRYSTINTGGSFQITDNSNNPVSGAEDMLSYISGASPVNVPMALFGYSTPATTSATTYKLRFKTYSGGTAELRNSTYSTGQIYAIEVAA